MKKAQNKSEIAGLPQQNLPAGSVSAARFSHPQAASTTAASAADTALTRTLKHAHDLISMQALQLCGLGAESLHVVIQPDADLQLALDLRMRGGWIDVQARLTLGDFCSLNRLWSDLQRQLELHGIRLAPLLWDEQIVGGRDERFRHASDKRKEDEARWAEAFEGLTSPRSLVIPPSPTRAKPTRRWESWD